MREKSTKTVENSGYPNNFPDLQVISTFRSRNAFDTVTIINKVVPKVKKARITR